MPMISDTSSSDCPPPLACLSESSAGKLGRLGLAAFLVFGVAASLLVLYLFNPVESRFYPFCMLHKMTGILCPGCGSLRALHQLLHGNILEAWRLNPLLVMALPFSAFIGVRLVMASLGRGLKPLCISPRFLWWGLAGLLAFTLARNL